MTNKTVFTPLYAVGCAFLLSAYAGTISPRAEVPQPVPSVEDKNRLAAEFKTRLDLNSHNLPAENAAFDSLVSRIMESPTSRKLASDFIKAGHRAAVSYDEWPGTAIVAHNDKERVAGIGAFTYLHERIPRVSLNKEYTRYDMDGQTESFAHEMFGHVVNSLSAPRELRDFYYYHTSDEEISYLIGWVVNRELGCSPGSDLKKYLKNPGKFRKDLLLEHPTYALSLTGEEMKGPLIVYKRRLAGVAPALADLNKKEEKQKEWREVIKHFMTVHDMNPAAFHKITEDIDGDLAYIPDQKARLRDVSDFLSKSILYYSLPEDKTDLAELRKASSDPWFKEKEAVINKLRGRLKHLLRGQEQSDPEEAGQISMEQLEKLWKADKRSCPSASEALPPDPHPAVPSPLSGFTTLPAEI